MSTSSKAHDLLFHIDLYILPLLRVELKIVKEAIEKFNQSYKFKNPLNRLDINLKLQEVVSLFPPDYNKLICSIFRALSTQIDLIGFHIQLIDLLQIITIFSQGSLNDKSVILFELFNFSGSGRMSEIELIRFISKASVSFQKLKLMGTLDVSFEDAKLIALLARTENSDNKIEFIPYLEQKDFHRFLETNLISKTIFKCVDTLERLYILMNKLDTRADLLLKELHKKEDPMRYRIPIPRMDILNCVTSCGKVIFLYKDETSCTVVLRSDNLQLLSEVYVRCKKIHTIDDINGCASYKETNFYQRCFLDKGKEYLNALYYKIRINQLDSGSRYHLSVYSEGLYFEEFAIRTESITSSLTDLNLNDTLKNKNKLVILPTSINSSNILELRRKYSTLHSTYFTYFTGSLLQVEKAFEKCLVYENLKMSPLQGDFQASVLQSLLLSLYFHSLEECIYNIFSDVTNSCPAPVGRKHLYESHQLFFQPHIGPWMNSESREYYSEKLGKKFNHIQKKLKTFHHLISDFLRPPEYVKFIGKTLVLSVSNPNEEVKYGIDLADIPKYIESVSKDPSRSNNFNEIIIVMDDPSALMSSRASWSLVQPTETEIIPAEEPAVQLTGAYEIKFGAYTEPLSKKVIAACQDNSLQQILSLLFQWSCSNRLYSRRVSLVSTNWMNGYNFDIADGVNHIRHYNLLTSDKSQMDSKNEIMVRLKNSCPNNTYININYEDNNGDRVFVLESLDESKRESNARNNRERNDILLLSCELPSIQSAVDKLSQHILKVKEMTKLSIVDGPALPYLTNTTAICTAKFQGVGDIVSYLYELPPNTNFSDAVAFLLSEKDKLKFIESQRVRSLKSLQASFIFNCLTPHTTYLISLEFGGDAVPTVCQFRSLPRDSSKVSSIMILPTSPKEFFTPSYRISKAVKLIDSWQVSVPVYNLETESTLLECSELSLNAVRAMNKISLDTANLNRRGSVVRVAQHSENKDIHYVYSGKFCRMAPNSKNISCIEKMTKKIDLFENKKSVKNLTIFVAEPLTPFVKRLTKDDKWVNSGPFTYKNGEEIVKNFIFRLLKWKNADPERDCQIISILDMKDPLLIVFSNKFSIHKIRHLVMSFTLKPTTCDYIFPNENFKIGSINYEIMPLVSNQNDIKINLPRSEFYPSLYDNKTDISYICLLDVMIKPTLDTKFDIFHRLELSYILDEIDKLKVTFGPVIGQVTSNSVKLIFEINMDQPELKCILKSKLDERKAFEKYKREKILKSETLEEAGSTSEDSKVVDEESTFSYTNIPTIIMEKVQGNKVIVFSFSDLLPNTRYDVYLPTITGDSILGAFKTCPEKTELIEFLFTGGNSLPKHEIISAFLDRISTQQMVDFSMMQRETEIFHQNPSVVMAEDAWTWLPVYHNAFGSIIDTTFHIGAHSIFPEFLHSVLENVIEHTKRLELPIRESSGIGALYFSYLEELIKDVFRTFLSIPSVKNSYKIGANLPIYHSKYMLPVPYATQENEFPINVIRKIFEAQVDTYITTLLNIPDDVEQKSKTWRFGNCVLVYLDIITDRKKVRKQKEVVDTPTSSNKEASSYSLGFLSRNQIKLVRDLLEDGTIHQLILVTEHPFINLSDIPTSINNMPEKIPKGEYLPWCPTVSDLDKFFTMLMRWVDPGRSSTRFTKHAILLSNSHTAYGTKIQESMTGVKIFQICGGNFVENEKSRVNTPENIKLAGTIGGMKYAHTFSNLDDFMIDSSRETRLFNQSHSKLNDSASGSSGGISHLLIWQDNWKATSAWKYMNQSPNVELPSGPALVLAGPYIGVPMDNMGSIYVPILIEIDRASVITVKARSIFQSFDRSWSFPVKARTPFVLKLGPFDLENRYILNFTSGLRNPLELLISTHTSSNETIYVILNADKNVNEVSYSSDFLIDIIKRNRVPFNGIAVNIHLNCPISLFGLISELMIVPGFINDMEIAVKEKKLSSGFRNTLTLIVEAIQNQFRTFLSRPSYVEAIKTGFNMLLTKRGEYILRENEIGDLLTYAETFLWLAAERYVQEYFNQILQPDENVFVYNSDSVVRTSDPALDRVDALFIQLLEGGRPMSNNSINNFISPNKKSVLEIFPKISSDNMFEVNKLIDDCRIDVGTRVIIIYPEDGSEVGSSFKEQTDETYEFISRLAKWIDNRADRAVLVFIPTITLGTQVIPLNEDMQDLIENFQISLVDSVFKNNESKRSTRFQEGEAKIKAARSSGGGKSKRALEKKMEEERLLAEQLQAEIDTFVKELGPDGYVLAECKTYDLTPPPPNDVNIVITSVASKILSSVPGGEEAELELYKDIQSTRPSPLNFIQAPDWLIKFSPGNQTGIFFQDEVTLLMRQDYEIRPILDLIEDDEMYLKINEIYNTSRLSDLTRPLESREVDLDIIGVKEYFLSEILRKIWDEAIPEEAKSQMVPLYDDFVKGFCLSRTMSGETAMASSEEFTQSIQKAMVISCALGFCLKMKDLEKWKFIMDGIIIKPIDGEESDLEELDGEEDRILAAEIAAEAKQIQDEINANKEGEDEQNVAKDESNLDVEPNSSDLKPEKIEDEIEKLDIKELISEAKDYFRNTHPEKIKLRRTIGEKFVNHMNII